MNCVLSGSPKSYHTEGIFWYTLVRESLSAAICCMDESRSPHRESQAIPAPYSQPFGVWMNPYKKIEKKC